MIEYDRFVLDNGLRVLVHQDHSTPMAVVNIMYDVGARDENPEKTGFAHLFEHLMFGGSIHIPDYDEPLQRAGGENNAYTTNDLTNYYCHLVKKVFPFRKKWFAKNSKNTISINPMVMYGIKCVNSLIKYTHTDG